MKIIERTFSYIETHITNHCNLNCISCTHYAPLADPWYKDINEYIKELAQLAVLARKTLKEFRILGGEPLLHPRINDFLIITREAFPSIKIELVTNGLLLPKMSNDFFDIINNFNISIYLSDYDLNNEIKEILKNKVKNYYIGKKDKFIKPALDLHSSDKEKNFIECYNYFENVCYNLRNGYLFHCPTEGYFDLFCSYFNINSEFNVYDNGLNIFNATSKDIIDYINKPSEFCKYCQIKNKLDIPYELSQKKASEWLA